MSRQKATKKKQNQKKTENSSRFRIDGLPVFIHPETAAAVRQLVKARGQIIWPWAFGLGERAIFRHRKPIPASEWAERHRVVHLSSRPGPWRNRLTPYAVGIMDAGFFPSVRTVSIIKCPQSGGTEAVHNCIGYAIDRDPGPVLYVYPDEATARENAQDRIIPMLHASPRLREYLTGMADDISALRIKMAHLTIYMAWSGSAARLGNKPIRYLVMDELDKYQASKREAAAEALAEKRVITWGRRARIWKLSTPTVFEGPIDRAFRQSEARFRYHVLCPACGCELLMDFEHIRWPEDVSEPVKIESRSLGYYECQHCHARWTDEDRNLAVRQGLWREEESGLELRAHLEKLSPISVGFHIPAWISPFVSLSEIAAKALSYQLAPNLELLKDLQNNFKGEPWREEHIERSEDTILALCDDRPRGTVPGPLEGKPRVACLLAGVDTQGTSESKGYFRYVIRAFGFGENEESWLVQAGSVPTFAALNEILWKSEYRASDGSAYVVRACMVDAMGARTREIYTWALRNRGRVFPWQGVQHMTQPYTPSPQEYFPDVRGNKVKIPGGLNLWRCDVTFFKSDLSARLAIAPDDPGAFHLHSGDSGILEQYAREMCAEVWDAEKNAWTNPNGRPNHFWDCEVMVLALAYILNVRHIPIPGEKPKKKPMPAMRHVKESIADRLGKIRR